MNPKALLVCLLLAGRAWGQDDFSRLSEALAAELKETGNPGAVVALIRDGRVVHVKTMGVASLETQEPLREDALFRVGSISKVVTSATAMQLVKQGKLDLDAPVGGYVKGLGPRVSKVTMRQLLSHTAGLRADIAAVPRRDELDESRLRAKLVAEGDSLLFTEPGAVFSYSNLGFSLAGLVEESIVGKPYPEAAESLVLRPAGMKSSGFHPTTAMTFPLAQGHAEDEQYRLRVVRPVRMDTLFTPAGFLFASVPDLTRLALYLMSSGALERMAEPVATLPLDTPERRSWWGMSLDVSEADGVRMASHGGRMHGHSSRFEIIPSRRDAVILATNAFDSPLPKTRDAAWEALEGKPAAAVESKRQPVPAAEAKALVGHYVNGSLRMEVFQRDGQLLLREPGEQVVRGEMEIRKTGENRYVCLPRFGKITERLVIVPGYFFLSLRALVKER